MRKPSTPRPPRRTKADKALDAFVPRAVLFDFDGVIVHSEPLHYAATRDTLAAESIRLTEDEYFSELIGFDDRGAFRRIFALRDRELDPPTMLRLMTTKSRRMMDVIHKGKYAALPGVSELVRALWRNYPLAICSGALRDEIEAMLEGIGLRDCFPVITAAEDVSVGKPDPQGYVRTAAVLAERTGTEIRPEHCLVVEDAPKVITTATAAGFKTLGVAGSGSLADLKHAHRTVSRLNLETFAKAFPAVQLGV